MRLPRFARGYRLRRFALVPILAALGPAALSAQGPGFGAPQGPQEPIDTAAIRKIKAEGFERSQVMDLLSWLTDVYAPRLTGAPQSKVAGDWTIAQLGKWGLANPRYEWWGPFGRGWENERMSAQITAPVPFPVIAYPSAWTDGTKGPINAEVVVVPSTVLTAKQFEPYRGKLKGKIVVSQAPPPVPPVFAPLAQRYTAEQLNALANPYPVGTGRGRPAGMFGRAGQPAQSPDGSPLVNLQQCFLDEGAAAVLLPSTQGNGGTVWPSGQGDRAVDAAKGIPRVTVAVEHYGRIWRMLERNVPVKMDLDVRNRFYTDQPNSFNIVAELPGTDKADEVVLIGAHFDTWHTSTGATDDGSGTAVMMEAMRILKTLNLPLRRTVRIGLWMGEEQGLIGSREYVTAHYGDRATMQLKPEHAKFDAYFNVDNGGGAIRGIYLQGNAAAGPIFAQWMRPLNSDSISVGPVAPGPTGGTDHQSFDAVGLPAFQFIQDPLEYNTRTHHSSQDLYERIPAADMKHNAVVLATFAYLAANRDELLPRKPLPQVGAAARGGPPAGAPRGGAQTTGCPRS
ncbi:MAG: M20/M25/M40 family metallo-hydrolase [Gemmatimonadetes bacterium]|nr:M20/M25/M40 family metallo-hydrolase [Gemmatimonadota bacterium]